MRTSHKYSFSLVPTRFEAVKEPHFWDFRQRKINSLRVKNHPFLEFFYSLALRGNSKHRACGASVMQARHPWLPRKARGSQTWLLHAAYHHQPTPKAF